MQQLTRAHGENVGAAMQWVEATVTFHKVSFSAAEVGDTDGLVTVSVECQPNTTRQTVFSRRWRCATPMAASNRRSAMEEQKKAVFDAGRVSMRVPGGLITHLLRMPSAKDVIEYRRGFARVLNLPFNKQELTINLAAAGVLYQKLALSTEGYAGAVPIIHQVVAVKAAIDPLDAGFQEGRTANF